MFCDQDYEEVMSVHDGFAQKNVKLGNLRNTKACALFPSEGFKDDPFKRLEKTFNDPKTELYLMFFQSSLALFTNFNEFFKGETLLYILFISK